jgi:hypothetical protein
MFDYKYIKSLVIDIFIFIYCNIIYYLKYIAIYYILNYIFYIILK